MRNILTQSVRILVMLLHLVWCSITVAICAVICLPLLVKQGYNDGIVAIGYDVPEGVERDS